MNFDTYAKISPGKPAIRLMRTLAWAIPVLVLFLAPGMPGSFGARPVRAQELTAREMLDKVDDLYRGVSSQGKMTMTIVTAHWTRSLSLEFQSKGKDKSLVRILAPVKEKGTATLRSGNEIWNYLPKVNRVVKLPSSMMSASWMGSHFTNDDLVKQSRFTEDYTFQIGFQGKRGRAKRWWRSSASRSRMPPWCGGG